MNRLHNVCSWLALALASGLSLAALKSKPAPEFPNAGATLDISDWTFRKSVIISNSGPQQLELDLDVLSNSRRDFADLRLMRQGEQIPYLVDATTIQRFITPQVVVTNDPQNPGVSRWMIHLFQPRLPVTELHCETPNPVFERDMTLYELVHEAESGDTYQRSLAGQRWTKTPGSAGKELTLRLNQPPFSDTLFLEARNGDNPPIQLDHFQIVYTTTRILFDAKAGDELFLYYGNDSVSAPRYDLNLVSNQLRSVDKAAASLGPEERLNKATSRVISYSVKGGVVFWGILALVVVVLLVVIARLLPKSPSP